MKLFLSLILIFQISQSYKFLVYSPLFGHSHTNFLARIADTLTAAGHNVTFFAPTMDEELLGKKTFSLTKDVIVLDADPRVTELYKYMHKVLYASIWELTPDPREMMKWAANMSEVFKHTCEHVMSQDKLLSELRSRDFDVGIAEPMSICGFGLFQYLGIDATIGAFSAVQSDQVSWAIGEPLAPSYVPGLMGTSGVKMGILERAMNVFHVGLAFQFMGAMGSAEGSILEQKLGESYSSPEELFAHCAFIFTNANPYLNYPRPLIHKTVEVGGISVDSSSIEKLDEKWSKILDERRHSVFLSFGSVAKSKDMPQHWQAGILALVKSLPEITFIWKYEVKTTIADDIPNLHLSPWLPQNALLADKRLSVFITHGGLGSTTELAHLGKAAIMIPLFGEQARNSGMLARHGGAIVVEKTDIPNPDIMKKHILRIINDESYTRNAEKLSRILRAQPIKPRELVVRHAEFVAEFGSLSSLDPYGRHLSLWQYYFIDVILVVIAVLLIFLVLVVFLVRCIIRRLIRRKKDKNE